MFTRFFCSAWLLGWVILLALPASGWAGSVNLYLKDGIMLRGEIKERSVEMLTLATASGTVKIETSRLMPISRAQLKLPEEKETSAEVVPSRETDVELLIRQVERLLAENESLKKQLADLKKQAGKKMDVPGGEDLPSPAEGPKDGKP